KPDDPALGPVAWLAGSWITEQGADAANRTINEEHWTQPAGGTMFGMNRTLTPGAQGAPARTTFFEYLRIESAPTGLVYLASPKGRQPPTPFKMVESSASPQRVVFENPQHDYPKRIIYWRDGNLMHARIEGDENGTPQSEEWTWRRARFE